MPQRASGRPLSTGQQREEAIRKRADYGSFYRARLVPQEKPNNQTNDAYFVLTFERRRMSPARALGPLLESILIRSGPRVSPVR
jgi:hypothetical protein